MQVLLPGGGGYLNGIIDLLLVDDTLYSLSRDGRLSVSHWAIGAGGLLSPVSDLQFYRLYGPVSASLSASPAGALLLAGADTTQLSSISLRQDGRLWRRQLLNDDGEMLLAISQADLDGEIRHWGLLPGTALPHALPPLGAVLAPGQTPAALPDANFTLMQAVGFGSHAVLIAVATDGTIQSYRSTAEATLVAVQTIAPWAGIGLNAPSATEVVTVSARKFMILAAAGNSSLTVIEVAANGTITPQHHIIDTQHSRFAAVSALASAGNGDRNWLVAGGAMPASACSRFCPTAACCILKPCPGRPLMPRPVSSPH